MTNEVRLQFVLFHKKLVAIEINAPVDVLRVVARCVFAVARELDGKTGQRRFVGPGQVADDQTTWLEMPVCHLT